MRQLINRLVAETAGDIEVREYRNARYLLRPGHSLEHQFFARLAPGVAKLKIEGFCLQLAPRNWKGAKAASFCSRPSPVRFGRGWLELSRV